MATSVTYRVTNPGKRTGNGRRVPQDSITVPGTAVSVAPGESVIVPAVDDSLQLFADYKASGLLLFEETADLSVAEFGIIDGITAGTMTAGKALVPTTGGLIDTLDITSPKIGGVALTPTGPEINTLDGGPHAVTFAVGSQGGDVIAVTATFKDANAVACAVPSVLEMYLSDASNGLGLTATAPDGGIAATTGTVIPHGGTPLNALLVHGTLAISATAEKFKTTTTAVDVIGGVSHTKTAADNLVFTAAHVITASKFGCVLIQIDAAGAVSTKVVASPQAYDDAPTALAALPAADAGKVALGHIAIENNAGDWTANTDDLTNASDLTTAAFVDATVDVIGMSKSFSLLTNASGVGVFELTESGAGTWYPVARLPNGKLSVSGAVTFS